MKTLSRDQYDFIIRIVKLTNPLLMVIPVILSCFVCCHVNQAHGLKLGTLLEMVVIWTAFYLIFGRIYEAFNVYLLRISEMICSQVLALLLSDVLLYLILQFISRGKNPPVWLLIVFCVQSIISAVWSYVIHRWYYATFPPQPTLIIYDMRTDIEQLMNDCGLNIRFRVVAVKHIDEWDKAMMEGIASVFLCGIHSHDRNVICKFCIEHGITVYTIPRVGDLIMNSAKEIHMFHLPMLRVERFRPVPEYVILKRLFDIIVSWMILIIFSPIMLITAAAIKLCDGGPVFYRQTRLTKDRAAFQLIKFRSMQVNAEGDGIPRISAGEHDLRVTSVGRILRKYHIDELPQCYNVLRGEMSLVGPRPERPEIAELYERELPEFRLRLQVKAGITGYAQVYGKYNSAPYDKLQMDLMYIAHPSLFEDFRIVLATLKILLLPDSMEKMKNDQFDASENRK